MLICTSQFCGNWPSVLATVHIIESNYYKNHTSNERQYGNSIIQNDNNLPLETQGKNMHMLVILAALLYIHVNRFTFTDLHIDR